MKIIGIHDGHGASAAVVEDGKLLAAVQEERLGRDKNRGGFPELAIAEVLDIAGLSRDDIDMFVYAGMGTHDWRASVDYQQLLFGDGGIEKVGMSKRIATLTDMGIEQERIEFVDHHICHVATAFYGQQKRDEKKLILTCDGFGDHLCGSVNIYENGKIRRLSEIDTENSAAVIYSMVTYLMGFKPFEEEYKIMGLAPYGFASKQSEMIAEKLLSIFQYDRFGWEKSENYPENLQNYLEDVIRFQRFDNIAAGVQKFIERFFAGWVANCINETGIKEICLSGGVFMNVKLNKAIMELGCVDDIFVFPSCGDETNSIGAAWIVAADRGIDIEPIGGFYYGREYSDEQIKNAIEKYDFKNDVSVKQFDDVELETAKLLAAGEIVARFKGKSEFGARALGNRSILADASLPDVVRRINEMIKMRDFWMPFAPAICDDTAGKYIDNKKDIPAGYMIMAFDAKIDQTEKMIAGLHPSDLTCRPQVICKEHNSDFYRLMEYYKKAGGGDVLLNTSFNLHGSAMVYSPSDALEVFDKSGLNYMAIGSFIIKKG